MTESFVILLSLPVKCELLETKILMFTTLLTFLFVINRLKQEKVKNVKIFSSSIFLNVYQFLSFTPSFF